MITAFIIAGGITLAIRELDPAVQKNRQIAEAKKRQILFLR